MRIWTLLAYLMAACCLVACAPLTGEPGTPQAFASVCDRANESLKISVEGYLRLPDTLDSKTSVMLRLYPDPSFSGKPVGVHTLFGDGPNQTRRITRPFRDSDLGVHLADGRAVPFRTRVRVSGQVHFPVVKAEYDCSLETPYLEIAP